MEEYLVKAMELTKKYGTFEALRGLDLQLERGKIIGLLGPNGSGKTTFIKILAGLLTPTGGYVTVGGKEPGYETKAMVSYLPERPYFNPSIKVSALIDYFSDFYEDFDAELAKKVLWDLGVDQGAAMKTLSKGTKEKVQLVLVMSRKARLYLLDEPIGGVDPAARDYVLRTIIGNYSPESSIIITTHLIADVERAIDDFAFMHYGGRIYMYGNADTVREHSGKSLDQLFREVFRC